MNAPLLVCGPTTGCGKTMAMIASRSLPNVYEPPAKCPHCGSAQYAAGFFSGPFMPNAGVTLTTDLFPGGFAIAGAALGQIIPFNQLVYINGGTL